MNVYFDITTAETKPNALTPKGHIIAFAKMVLERQALPLSVQTSMNVNRGVTTAIKTHFA